MATLVPTPVTLENLIDETSAINVINPAAAQAVSPRNKGTDTVIVAVTDDPWEAGAYWVQKNLGGNWVRSNAKTGNDSSIAYTLPVNTAATVVHGVVYPIALADIGTYPPITSAETA